MSNIVAGFHSTGVYPYYRSVVPNMCVDDRRQSLAERTGLQFIPL